MGLIRPLVSVLILPSCCMEQASSLTIKGCAQARVLNFASEGGGVALSPDLSMWPVARLRPPGPSPRDYSALEEGQVDRGPSLASKCSPS